MAESAVLARMESEVRGTEADQSAVVEWSVRAATATGVAGLEGADVEAVPLVVPDGFALSLIGVTRYIMLFC